MTEETRWLMVERRLTAVETFIQEIKENHLPSIHRKLEWIENRLNRGYRPPWNVVMLITFLSSACVGLLVALVR